MQRSCWAWLVGLNGNSVSWVRVNVLVLLKCGKSEWWIVVNGKICLNFAKLVCIVSFLPYILVDLTVSNTCFAFSFSRFFSPHWNIHPRMGLQSPRATSGGDSRWPCNWGFLSRCILGKGNWSKVCSLKQREMLAARSHRWGKHWRDTNHCTKNEQNIQHPPPHKTQLTQVGRGLVWTGLEPFAALEGISGKVWVL